MAVQGIIEETTVRDVDVPRRLLLLLLRLYLRSPDLVSSHFVRIGPERTAFLGLLPARRGRWASSLGRSLGGGDVIGFLRLALGRGGFGIVSVNGSVALGRGRLGAVDAGTGGIVGFQQTLVALGTSTI